MLSKLRLAILDMDGVIFEGKNFWLDLHRAYGNEEQALAFYNKYMTEPYDYVFGAMARKFWRGVSTIEYMKVINNRCYVKGISEVTTYFKKQAIPMAIISSGPLDLAERAQKELGFNYIFANQLMVEQRIFSGHHKTNVPNDQKLKVFTSLIEDLRIQENETIVVGDSYYDAQMAQHAGLSIAYDSHSIALNRSCQYELKKGELARIIDIVKEKITTTEA